MRQLRKGPLSAAVAIPVLFALFGGAVVGGNGVGWFAKLDRPRFLTSKATSATSTANISVAKATGRRPAPKRTSEMIKPTALMRMLIIAGTIPRAVAP